MGLVIFWVKIISKRKIKAPSKVTRMNIFQ